MVQLKAQELEHRECVERLKGQVAWSPLPPVLSPGSLLLAEGMVFIHQILGWLPCAGCTALSKGPQRPALMRLTLREVGWP